MPKVQNVVPVVPKTHLPKTSVEENYAEFEKQASQRLTPQQAKVLKRIGECESGFRMIANSTGSSAYGVFQIMKVHNWRGDRMSLKGNIKIAIDLFLEQGTTPWNASIKCWSKK